MPCEVHPKIGLDWDDDAVVWRYMDLAKFIDLCKNKALYFSRLDQMTDPFEGKFSTSTINNLPESVTKEDIQKYEKIISSIKINCWNVDDDESIALWNAYVKERGIAIRTTISSLKDCFTETSDNIMIGQIRYVDLKTKVIPTNNIFYPIAYKRKFFSFEKELRLFYQEGNQSRVDHNNEGYIEVDLSALIHKIVIHPGASQWYEDLIKYILTKFDLYELVSRVIRSGIDDNPPSLTIQSSKIQTG